CHFYETPRDLADVLVPYFKAGLAQNEFCMWVASDPFSAEDARRTMLREVEGAREYLENGQMEIVRHSEWYVEGGSFDLQRTLRRWRRKLDWALDRGFAGARVTGNTAWLEAGSQWASFREYEETLDLGLGDTRMLAACSYSLEHCGSNEIIDVVKNHEFALIKRDGSWELIESQARKEMKLALRDSKANLRSFYESAPFMMGLIESQADDLRHVSFNTAAAAYFGLPDGAEAQDLSCRRHMSSEAFALWVEQHRKAKDHGRPVVFELPRTPGANGRWLSATVAPVSGARRGGERFCYVIADVTESRLAWEQIRQLNAALERRASDLAATNAELEAFDYSVSHDLRTPAVNIRGLSQMVLEIWGSRLDPDARAAIEQIGSEARREEKTIDALLGFARLRSSELEVSRVDLSGLCRAILERLAKSDPGRSVTVSVQGGLWADGDERLMAVALENLLSNAWKYTSKRQEAAIEFARVEKDGEVAFMVRDTGAGFSMTYAGKLFNAFQRLHSTSEFPGIGDGLATVRRIVERHGGRVWAESEPDKGARFFFTLTTRARGQERQHEEEARGC
ncbi:MAG: MEDS domain-containing protein, partial [Candidatus Riflebacteria bacterium]|nr:MEDS domain-containing protein [Candidatus Riflebacteria bacterium]